MWQILIKLNDDHSVPGLRPWKKGINEYEISVIKMTNRHGYFSWGWADGDSKIILYSPMHFGTPLTQAEFVTKKQWDVALGVAQAVCNHLNGIK